MVTFASTRVCGEALDCRPNGNGLRCGHLSTGFSRASVRLRLVLGGARRDGVANPHEHGERCVWRSGEIVSTERVFRVFLMAGGCRGSGPKGTRAIGSVRTNRDRGG